MHRFDITQSEITDLDLSYQTRLIFEVKLFKINQIKLLNANIPSLFSRSDLG